MYQGLKVLVQFICSILKGKIWNIFLIIYYTNKAKIVNHKVLALEEEKMITQSRFSQLPNTVHLYRFFLPLVLLINHVNV